MKKARIFSLLSLILLAVHILAPVAAAHPLGNFTINQSAGLHLTPEMVTLNFILDMAEIPAFQEIVTFDANNNGQPDPAEVTGYAASKCALIQPKLQLRFNGSPARLKLAASAVEFPPGAGNLPTLRLACTFQSVLPAVDQNLQIEFENKVFAERLGWREIVVTGEGVSLQGDLAGMTSSTSQNLTLYPDDLLNDPPNQRQVSFGVKPDSILELPLLAANNPDIVSDQTLANRNDAFTALIASPNLTLSSLLIALGIAFSWGAAHALTPGHGKTIVAAYLVGSRGTIRHAIFLGLTTTITHTAGVFLLGFLTLFAARFILPEQLYPWLGAISGVLVVWIGLSLFQGRLAGLLGRETPHHHHHHHDHTHSHEPHDHHHSHLPSGDGPITWQGLLALGISGGLIPCPSALIVMLSAIALQRIGFGLILIIAFSLGLAGVLTAIGVLWVQARRLFEASAGRLGPFQRLIEHPRWLQLVPVLSALFIIIVGAGITWQALSQAGIFDL